MIVTAYYSINIPHYPVIRYPGIIDSRERDRER